MRVIAIASLRSFWELHPEAEIPLRTWYAIASRADWQTPTHVKATYRQASFTANNRVIFNIKGNSYRLVVAIHYERGIIFIRFIGTHAEYDKINVEAI